jgi:anti-sigma factor RsiW
MCGTHEHLPPADEADLAALADGCLSGSRQGEVEVRVAADPALAAAVERQRAALAMLAAVELPAPLALRLRVEELKAARVASRRRSALAAALGLTATLVLLTVLLLAARGPALDDVLAVTLRPATAPAASGEAFEGVRFPLYERWRMTGARTDVIDGRRVRTVFYERDGRTIAYAIVAGPALDDVGELRAVRGPGDLVAVTWTRAGRTCVIAGSGVDADLLARLAVVAGRGSSYSA